ncbi:PREDICTED: myosin-3 isoform X2 [Nelumbo nucifera]|nr:PREDICTED: myosin-3 isoform X2 [Nelumbo nucifera]
MEAEKQVKFFQGCVAAAFAERDHSLVEAEKAKEKEELMSQKLNDFQRRLEELTSECLEERKLSSTLQVDLAMLKDQNENFKKVINKFYEIRESTLGGYEDRNWDDKCACLLQDPTEMWSFDDSRIASTSKYIGALEEELERLRCSVDNLQNKLRVGLEIEDHLKKKIHKLEKKRILSDDVIMKRISELRHFYTLHRFDIKNLLEKENAQFTSMIDMVKAELSQFHMSSIQTFESPRRDERFDDIEYRDVHITNDAHPNVVAEKKGLVEANIVADETLNTSDALAQALREKVAALLLLSQQEERHLLERNVNVALQKKIEELQRNLLQVTNEKVKALMELAQLRQEYQLLQENISHEMNQGSHLANIGHRSIATHEKDGRLRNLLKKTYLRRWVGRLEASGNEADDSINNQGIFTNKRSNQAVDFARIKVENASLKESLESMDHLTSLIHRLRISLLKVKDPATFQDPVTSTPKALDEIIAEAKLMKTALSSSLPISWSADADPGTHGGNSNDVSCDGSGDSWSEKVDSVSAAGLEMVELLILACQNLKESNGND